MQIVKPNHNKFNAAAIAAAAAPGETSVKTTVKPGAAAEAAAPAAAASRLIFILAWFRFIIVFEQIIML